MLKTICFFICGLCISISTKVLAQSKFKGIEYPREGSTYDIEFVINFTKFLHGIHRYDSFVLYSQPNSIFRPDFMILHDFEQALNEDFNIPIIVWGIGKTAKLRHNIGLNNLVFVQLKGLTDPILDTVDYTLDGLHFISIIFYFQNKEKGKLSIDEIRTFFEWCWNQKMVNVALTFQHYEKRKTFKNHSVPIVEVTNKVYSYSPFPKLKIRDLSKQVGRVGGAFMIDFIEDVKGYEFRTPMRKILPYIFLLKDPPNCETTSPSCKVIMSGTTGRLYTEYIRQINGKIKIEELNSTDFDFERDLVLAASRNEVHIGVLPFSRLTLSSNMSEGSYPFGVINACVIVPLITEYDKAKYFQSPFQLTIWMLIALTFFVLIILQLGQQYDNVTLAKQNTISFGQALITTASMLLAQANVLKFLYKRSSIFKLFHVFILVMTFLLSGMYSASLTSFLSSVQLGVQIDTLEQFLASGIKILTTESEQNVMVRRASFHRALEQSFQIVDSTTLARHRNNLDNRYAYIINSDQWLIISNMQHHLSKPLFRMPSAELCSESHNLKLPLQWNSPFASSLALFFMAAQESGLSRKWEQMSIAEAKILKMLDAVRRRDKPWRPLNAKDYHIFFYLIGALWCLSFSCFMREKFCYKKNGNWLRNLNN